MPPSENTPRVHRNQRKARKLDRRKVLELADRGVPSIDIARIQGVNHSTVWRFLRQMEPERQAVERFKTERADTLAGLHLKSVAAQDRIISTILQEPDGVLNAMTPSQKSGLLMALNATGGTIFDKERLERGQSTQNHGIIGKLMGAALDAAFKPDPKKAAFESSDSKTE